MPLERFNDRHKRLGKLPLAVVVVAAAGALVVWKLNARPPVTADDVAIYAAVLDARPLQKDKVYTVVDVTVRGETTAEDLSGPGELSHRIPAGAADSFHARNRVERHISSIPAHVTVQMITPADVQSAFRNSTWDKFRRKWLHGPPKGWWPDFYQAFPHSVGTTRFSAPGYSSDGKFAVVYFAQTSGGLDGEGSLIGLERIQSGWRVKWTRGLWVS